MKFCVFGIMFCQLCILKVSGENSSIPKKNERRVLILHTTDKTDYVEQGIIVRRVEETLNLTCNINKRDTLKYKLSWQLPSNSKNSKNRLSYEYRNDESLTLVIQHLQENDSGEYRCTAINEENSFNGSVIVNVKDKKCTDLFFTCPMIGNCISNRYVCDGRADCKYGEDESESNCGPSPCHGKITCDGRCIPMSWCCQPYHDLNCTIKTRPSCCHQVNKPYTELDSNYVMNPRRFSDINFLQTTIYTIIGCAMAFMLIITTLVIAICRVHMKRNLMSRYPQNSNNSNFTAGLMTRPSNINHQIRSEQHFPLYDLDVYLNRSAGLVVTYNINSGVQFVGHPVDPPPYCEVVTAPPREDPPPPYASRETLEGEALLDKHYSSHLSNQRAARGSEDSSTSLSDTQNATSRLVQVTHHGNSSPSGTDVIRECNLEETEQHSSYDGIGDTSLECSAISSLS